MRVVRPSSTSLPGFLDELNQHPNLDMASDCPKALRTIFDVINRTRLEFEDLKQPMEEHACTASNIYDKQLMCRAQEMARACSDRGLNGTSEFQWQETMSRHAFLSLNSSQEEVLNNDRKYHHCLACSRIFPSGSRPLLCSSCDTASQVEAETVLEPLLESQFCSSHLNLPHFVLHTKLGFGNPDESTCSDGFPDATISLRAYNLKNEPWQEQRPDLRSNPWIQLFSTSFMENVLQKRENLKSPHGSMVLKDGSPLFSFALWEAKKTDGDSSWSAFRQLDKKVRCLLKLQNEIMNTAGNDAVGFVPVVWAFTSVGPVWAVHGCYQSIYKEDGKPFGSSVELWSGNVSDKNKALQFLWIVDIIKFWAEYTLKPFIGACLTHIKAEIHKCEKVSLDQTMWSSHIALSKMETPWFFFQETLPRYAEAADERPILDLESPSDLCLRFSEPAPVQTLRRQPTLDEELIENFTWIQDRDSRDGHLLVIRIGRDGKISKPLVLIRRDRSSSKNLDETPSHSKVDVRFFNMAAVRLLKISHRFSSADQFCLFLPLDSGDYQDQRRMRNRKFSFFEPIENQLDLDGLYGILDPEYCATSDEESFNQDDDDSTDSEDEEDFDVTSYWQQVLKDVNRAWRKHNWPTETNLGVAFARVALSLQSAKRQVVDLEAHPVVYPDDMGSRFPDDWMTHIDNFGESAIFLTEEEESGSTTSKSAVHTPSEDSHPESLRCKGAKEQTVSKSKKKSKSCDKK